MSLKYVNISKPSIPTIILVSTDKYWLKLQHKTVSQLDDLAKMCFESSKQDAIQHYFYSKKHAYSFLLLI